MTRNHSFARSLVSATLVLVLVAAFGAPSTAAVVIAVPNGSFEASSLGDGGFDSAPIPDWVISGSFSAAGAFNPTDAQFSGTTGGSPPSPAEGTNIGLTNLSRSGVAGSGFSVFTSAASLATVQPMTIYELTVAVGRRSSSFVPDQYQIEMLVNDVVVPESTVVLDGNTITADTFQDMVSRFTATDALVGGTLKVRVTHSTFAGSGTAAGHFDNVRLQAIAIPEPSTCLMFACGLAGLIGRWRRERRTAAGAPSP